MSREVTSQAVNFKDPAADARWPVFKAPAGGGGVSIISASVVCDTALNTTDANARKVLLQNGGAAGAGTTEVATTTGVDTVGVDEVWTLTVDATAGNFIIGDGTETHTAAFNISAGNLQTELRTWTELGTNTVTVTGGPGDSGGTTPYVITVDAHDAAFDPTIVFTAVDDGGGTPLSGGGATVAIVQTTPGVAPSTSFDWVAATPKALTIAQGDGYLAEGEYLVVKYDETGTDAFKNLTVVFDWVRGVV